MRAWTAILALLILLCTPAAALAQTASSANTELARQHYKKASQLYDIGRFDEALAEYEKAYSLREDPSLLFNMAQTCRRKGDLKRAQVLYKNYLIKDPESPLRAEVESRIKALKAQIEQADRAAAEAAPLAPIPTSPSQALEPTAPAPIAPAPTPPSLQGAPQAPAPPNPAAPLVPETPVPPAAHGTYPAAQPQTAPEALPVAAPGTPQAPLASPTPPAPSDPAAPATYPAPMPFAQQTAPVAAPQETGSSGWPLMITGTVVTVGGLVCLGLGVYNAVQTKLLSDEVSSAKTFNPKDDEQGKRAQRLQWIEGGIGIGAIVVGSTLFAIGSLQNSSRQSKLAVVPVVQPDGVMWAATGAF